MSSSPSSLAKARNEVPKPLSVIHQKYNSVKPGSVQLGSIFWRCGGLWQVATGAAFALSKMQALLPCRRRKITGEPKLEPLL